MNEINEEINQTINAMQRDIDDGAYNELQNHLQKLLEIKRNELQRRLTDTKKTLTAEELKAGGWWCADVSEECRQAFLSLGFKTESKTWGGSYYDGCFIYKAGSNLVDRGYKDYTFSLKQIRRIGNDFYWSEE